MDDGPRIGGAQYLFFLIGLVPACIAASWITSGRGVFTILGHVWFALLLVVAFWGVVGWLEVYARRRERQEEERRRSTEMPLDPFAGMTVEDVLRRGAGDRDI